MCLKDHTPCRDHYQEGPYLQRWALFKGNGWDAGREEHALTATMSGTGRDVPLEVLFSLLNGFTHLVSLFPNAPCTCLNYALVIFKLFYHLSHQPNFFQGLGPSDFSQNPQSIEVIAILQQVRGQAWSLKNILSYSRFLPCILFFKPVKPRAPRLLHGWNNSACLTGFF